MWCCREGQLCAAGTSMHLHADLRYSRAQQLVSCQLLRLQEGHLLLSSVGRPRGQLKLLQHQKH